MRTPRAPQTFQRPAVPPEPPTRPRRATQADGRALKWKDKTEPVIGADGRLFSDETFKGDAFFNKRIGEEALSFSVHLTSRVLFLLASTVQEKWLWVHGINMLVAGDEDEDDGEWIRNTRARREPPGFLIRPGYRRWR